MYTPTKFRKKPVVIDAMLYDGTGACATAIINWGLDHDVAMSFGCYTPEQCTQGDHVLNIPTLEGTMTAQPGDWIIKGVGGEFYPCKPDIFAQTYEVVVGAK